MTTDRHHPLRLYGHRGAPAERPENTMASFQLALELGANALETDVHLTRDEHVVVSHDPDGRRMADTPAEIRALTLEELAAWDCGYGWCDAEGRRPWLGQNIVVPTLVELLQATDGIDLNIDIKARDRELVRRTLAALRKHGAEGRVVLASFHSEVLTWIQAEGWRGPLGMGQREIARLVVTPRLAVRLVGGVRGDAAQVPVHYRRMRFDTRWFIDKCHAQGKRVDFWTIDDPEEAERLYALGADGIMTDDPRAIAPVFEAAKRGAR